MKTPVCSTIIVCDEIRQCAETGKVSAIGIVAQFAAPSFPAAAEFGIFVAMTSGQGYVPFIVEIVDVAEEHVLTRFERFANLSNPMHTHQFCGKVKIVWPVAGVYLLRLVCGGVEIGCRRINVIQSDASA